jgi:hypothetical protein
LKAVKIQLGACATLISTNAQSNSTAASVLFAKTVQCMPARLLEEVMPSIPKTEISGDVLSQIVIRTLQLKTHKS